MKPVSVFFTTLIAKRRFLNSYLFDGQAHSYALSLICYPSSPFFYPSIGQQLK
jgi:hypothetical protein